MLFTPQWIKIKRFSTQQIPEDSYYLRPVSFRQVKKCEIGKNPYFWRETWTVTVVISLFSPPTHVIYREVFKYSSGMEASGQGGQGGRYDVTSALMDASTEGGNIYDKWGRNEWKMSVRRVLLDAWRESDGGWWRRPPRGCHAGPRLRKSGGCRRSVGNFKKNMLCSFHALFMLVKLLSKFN